MAVLMQWQGSLKLWLYETKANFLFFVHYRERLPAERKARCANYCIHESFLKYVMDFSGLLTGKWGDRDISVSTAIHGHLFLLSWWKDEQMDTFDEEKTGQKKPQQNTVAKALVSDLRVRANSQTSPLLGTFGFIYPLQKYRTITAPNSLRSEPNYTNGVWSLWGQLIHGT